jgi:hypothetical protein
MMRFLLLCALAVCGCGVFKDSEVVASRLIYAGDTASIQIPATVTRGVQFEIVVETFGGGCFSDVPAATIVDINGSTVTVSPFDLLEDEDVCTDDLRFIRHVALVTLDITGAVLFRFLGVEAGGGTTQKPAEIQRTVVSVAP